MFEECLNPGNQLLSLEVQSPPMHLAWALMARGNITLSELNSNVDKMKSRIRMPSWNADGFKTGLWN